MNKSKTASITKCTIPFRYKDTDGVKDRKPRMACADTR